MRRLMHLGLMMSLAGGMAVVPEVLHSRAVLALPDTQVQKYLVNIPVFIVANNKGVPIERVAGTTHVITFFLDPSDATTFLKIIKSKNPALGKVAQIKVGSLAAAYNLAHNNKEAVTHTVYEFIPDHQQVEAAMALLKQQGHPVTKFDDIPLFFAQDTKTKGLLTISLQNRKAVPFFFSVSDLDHILAQYKQKNPQAAPTIVTQVTTLSRVVSLLVQGKDPALQYLTLIPASNVRSFVRPAPSPAPSK